MSSIHLELAVTALPPDGVATVCPACDGHLLLHQPDERLPDRLLGTCQSCMAWYLIDAVAAQMVHLPDNDTLRDA